jgi:phospholipid/cholesterol/gamma-HCH transport system substrate-binding protein
MPTKKKVGIAELRVGLMVLLSIVLLIAVILSISGDIMLFNNFILVRTRLSQVDGLRIGTEVRLAGVNVGQVKEINLLKVAQNDSERRNVEVVMKINKLIDGVPAEQRIRSDSQVILGSVGLLGDKVIDITPGTMTGQAVTDGGEIRGAEEVTIREMVNGANDILGNFNLLSNQIRQIAEDINKGKGTAGLLLKDEKLYENLNRTLLESQELVQRIREGDGTVGKLLNDPGLYNQIQKATDRMEQLIMEVSNGQGTIGRLINDDSIYNRADKILVRLDEVVSKLDRSVSQLQQGQGTLGQLLTDDKLYRETQATLENINRLSTRLEKGEGSVGRLLQDPELYNNANAASVEVVKLLSDFRRDPKKYLTIKVRIF